jgi:predicted O-methyltransferase YrrM
MHRALQYIRYLIQSQGRHGVHSPFVYRLIEEVLNDSKRYYPFHALEAQRSKLQRNNEMIAVRDMGAGSRSHKSANRRVAAIAFSALKRPKYARLLFRLVNHLKYADVLELGTSLGITTAYFAAAGARVVTLEGCGNTLQIAASSFEDLELSNLITRIEGPFETTIHHPAVQAEYDLIFIDGHHIGAAMLTYYNELRKRLKPGGCMVIDDINWSRDMHEAWKHLLATTDLNLQIDLFEMGLLIDRPEMEAQMFTLRY